MGSSKRIQYHRYGGPDVLRLEEFDPGPPGKGQVRVRVHAAAANPMDWKIRRGDMKIMTGWSFPRGLGHDFSGVVEAVGEGVTRFQVGDSVFGAVGMKAAGAFAETVLADEKSTVKKPDAITFEQAATLPIVGVTALQALTGKQKLQPGQAVFLHGCLGGVGRAAAQIAMMWGASVAGSCRPSAADEAAAIGIDPIVPFDFDPTPMSGRFDLVFDTAGRLSQKAARTLLRPGGRIVDINPTPAKLARSLLPGPYTVLMAKPQTQDLEEVARLADNGVLRVPIARSVTLGDAIGALVELETKQTPKGGKVVVTTV